MLFRLIQISENIKCIKEELKKQNPQIPLMSITGFRNRIVHDYGKVDISIVYQTISVDVYELRDLFNRLIAIR